MKPKMLKNLCRSEGKSGKYCSECCSDQYFYIKEKFHQKKYNTVIIYQKKQKNPPQNS